MSNNNILFFIDWIILDIVLCIALFNIHQLSTARKIIKIQTKSFISIGIILGSLCIVSADYFGYRKMIERLSLYGMSNEIEPIYWYVGKIINYNIIFFRFVLIGIYIPLLAIVFKLFNLKLQVVYNVFFIVLFLIASTVLRSSLADVIMWLGIIIYWRNKSLLSFIIMLILCGIGLILHKSSFMVIMILLLSFTQLKKAFIQFSILLIPIAIIVIRIVIPFIFSKYFDSYEYDTPQTVNSTIGSIKIIINWIFTLTFGLFILLKSRNLCYDYLSKKIYNCVFWGLYIWFIFQFSGVSRFVGDRFYAHTAIPLIYLIALIICRASKRIKLNTCFFLFLDILVQQIGILVVWAYHTTYLQKNIYI